MPYLGPKMYRWGIEFSLPWVQSLGDEKLPDEVVAAMDKCIDEMHTILAAYAATKGVTLPAPEKGEQPQ